MKSFADWTQELAESVGPVEHHWETRKEEEVKPYNGAEALDKLLDDALYGDSAIAPNWQNPGAPVPSAPPMPQASHPQAVAYDECANCMKKAYLYEHDVYGKKYHVCSACLHVLTGVAP